MSTQYYPDLFIIFSMSLLTFALFGLDKHRAVYDKRRIPEALLLVAAALGGAFGALCGMIFFNHKTEKRPFLICVPVFLFLQLALDILCRVCLSNIFLF